MGNSGSMNGLPGYDDATAYHYPGYHHQYQRYHEMMRANGGNSGGPTPAWLESYQRDLRNGRSTFDNRHHHHDSGTHRESTVSSGPSLPPPMKVLPDIPGRVAKLRPTNNGNILHSGGTISKNNNLQRSKSISSPTYQQHTQQSSFNEAEENGGILNSLPPRMAMMRSKTQFNMMAGGVGRQRDFEDSRRGYATNQRKPSYEHGTLNKKRFGSEPDLRLSMAAELQQEQESGQAGHRNTKPVQSKIMKGKNKKKAPVPPAAEKREPENADKHQQPQLQQQQQRIIAYSPLRKTNSDASSTLPSSDSNSNNPTRKLRLFKTRAETKKNIITKLPEASDAKYQAKPTVPNGQLKTRVSPTNSGNGSPYKPPRKDPDFDTSTLDKPKSRLNPTSFFRREKTFDLGILERDRHAQQPEVKPTMSPPISRRKSIVKSLLEKDQKEQQQLRQQEQQQQQQQSRITSVEPKFKPKVQEEKRKPSQPQAATTPVMTDFQKELAMATRRKTALGGSNPNLAQTKPAPTGTSQQRKMSEVTKQTIKVEPAPPPTTKTNSLVISVEPPKQDDREKLSISPPPPPPPLPKTSFYFGMTAPKKTAEQKISPTLLVKAKMLETRVDSEPETSEDEEKRPLESPSDDSEMDKTQLDVIDRFAASLLNGTKFQSGSDSAASSEVDVRTTSGIELFTEGQEISLKLRPTLPRKNFEIPRFSPAAAWRLLTTEDDFGRDSTELFPFADQKKTMLRSLEAVDAAAEDRIERIYREPIPGLQDNKSGDSGISGDAGLPDIGEAQMINSSKERDSPESSPVDDVGGPVGVAGTNGWSANAIRLTPWTPQQDLEDDDDTTGSSADNRQLIEESPLSGGPNDFSSKGHLFSLSLPRENHLSIYTGTAANGDKVEKHMFNSLQKLRKSVSDAFTSDAELSPLESGDNWFLSRLDSSPPAITNAYEKRQLSPTGPKQSPPEAPSSAGSAGSKKNDSEQQFSSVAKPTKHLPIGYLISGKHMMYLPKEATKVVVTSGKNDANNNSVPTEAPLATVSSYANRSGYGADKRKDNKENMQDPVPAGNDNGGAEMEKFPVKISNRKNHRFTFQSTIRQIEKRRVAEKLSREAEIKEAMRLSELEAMRRVEEEFQKKRAREKASIRHQLRLFSMEEGSGGQGFDGNEEDELPELIKRAEPEGDSMPHQPSSTTATNGSAGKSNGMFRKKDATLERQTYLNGGGQARRLSQSRFHQTTTLERKYSANNQDQDVDFNNHHDEDEDDGDDDDDDVDSSLGYIDTRTPYISRIIQAKSSKSYGGGGLKK